MAETPNSSPQERESGVFGSGINWMKEQLGFKEPESQEVGPPTLDQIKEDIEKTIGYKIQFYQSGEHTNENPETTLDDVAKRGAQVVTGSVSEEGWSMLGKDMDERDKNNFQFYREMSQAAAEAMEVAELYDPAAFEWYAGVLDGLVAIEKFKDFSDGDFVKKQHRKDLYNFVKKNGDKSIYGSKGAYQFLKAFMRARRDCPQIAGIDKVEDFKPASLNIKTIKLVLGVNKGEEGRSKDRYSMVAWLKEQAPGDDEAKRRDAEGEDGVRGRGGLDADGKAPEEPLRRSGEPEASEQGRREPDIAPAAFPAIGSDEFYEKYEIDEAMKADFTADVAAYNKFLDDANRGMNFLTNSKFFEQNDGESPDAYDARITALMQPGGEIHELYAKILQGYPLYEKFFEDTNNPESVKYQQLFVVVMKRMMEYSRKFSSDQSVYTQAQETLLLAYERLSKNPQAKQPALEKMLELAEILADPALPDLDFDDDGVMDKAQWEALKQKYQQELSTQ